MAESSKRFESLHRDIDALTHRLDAPSVLIVCSLLQHVRVETSTGRLRDIYPIDAGGRKDVHENGAQSLYCEHVVDRDAPLHVRDSCQETEQADNGDEVEFNLSNYPGYPIHTPDDTPYDTVCVPNSQPCGYSAEERALLEGLRRKIEALLAEAIS